MFESFARLASICFIGLLTSGCWVAGIGVKSMVVTAVVPAAPPGSPGAQLPLIQLEYDGQRLAGLPGEYAWSAGRGYRTGSFAWSPALSFPATLTSQAGQTITVVVSAAPPPVVVWVTELDKQGLPMASSVLTTTSNAIPYTLSVSGQYVLTVRAYWTYEKFMTYLFSMAVSPEQRP
jgi:hypothetical protein